MERFEPNGHSLVRLPKELGRLLCPAVLLCALSVAAQNLLQNPGFESGTTGWFGFGAVNFTASTLEVHSGARAALVQNRTAAWNGVAQSLLGVLAPAVTYQFSAWIRVETNTPQAARLTLKIVQDGVTTYANLASATAQPVQWTQLSGSYVLNSVSGVTDLTLYLEGPAPGVSFEADDFDAHAAEPYDWKAAANSRIEQVRKRDVRLLVLDTAGHPVPGVGVTVNQTRHLFGFGSAINQNIANSQYAAFFRSNFEWAVMENDSKWYANEPSQGNVTYVAADRITNYCFTNHITLRGHCLFWAVDRFVQAWVTNLSNAALTNAVSNRLASAVNHFRGIFRHWDVNNEMLHGNFFGNRLGDWVNPWMFQQAHALDPDVTLFVNDYNVVAAGETDAYKQQIQQLLAAGAPVGGIGAQCHFQNPVSPTLTESRLDSLAELGLPIWVSEYDYASTNEIDRADQLETLYRIAFSKASVEGIMMWGFWAGSHWRGSNAAIVNLDWTLNEAGRRYQALMSEWTTRTNGMTAADGGLAFRGFHGSYDLTLTRPGGSPAFRRITLDPGAGTEVATVILTSSGAQPVLHGASASPVDRTFQFQLTGDAGRAYEIQGSTNLTNWAALASVSNAMGTIGYTNSTTASPVRFFRARLLP